MRGVLGVTVGYAGGKTEWPTYRSIQDHTEACRIEFDPTIISYRDILISFFDMHSPFSAPYSRQYRSAILVHNDEQQKIADDLVATLQVGSKRKIYTSIEPHTDFYRAEEYHQKYIQKSRGKY